MEYELVRSKRKTICLQVKSGQLVVRAPYLVPRFLVDRFIHEKGKWIEKTLEKSNIPQRKEKHFEDGEKLLYLGEEKTLKLKGGVSTLIDGEALIVNAENKVEAKTRLRKYYKIETIRMVKEYILKYKEILEATSPKITYKFYKSKWGSCSAKNDFSFNALLSMAPEKVIEYVVIHELSHIKIKNHSRIFWNKVEAYDPSYRKHRRWLKENHYRINI